jgi:hypothetical protein
MVSRECGALLDAVLGHCAARLPPPLHRLLLTGIHLVLRQWAAWSYYWRWTYTTLQIHLHLSPAPLNNYAPQHVRTNRDSQQIVLCTTSLSEQCIELFRVIPRFLYTPYVDKYATMQPNHACTKPSVLQTHLPTCRASHSVVTGRFKHSMIRETSVLLCFASCRSNLGAVGPCSQGHAVKIHVKHATVAPLTCICCEACAALSSACHTACDITSKQTQF